MASTAPRDRPPGAPTVPDDDFARVLETAQRLRHRLSLVATLPAVRRLRNFLNPNSRIPESTSPMVLLGCRYDRGAKPTTPDEDDEHPPARSLDEDATSSDADDDASPRRRSDVGASSSARSDDASRLETVRAALRRRFRRDDVDGSVHAPPAGGAPSALLSSDEGLRRFADDFRSRAWITYRRNFVPFEGSTYGADAGWGCTMRSGQMLLANALSTHFFGRAWRWRPIEEDDVADDGDVDEETRDADSRAAAEARRRRRRVAVADAAAHATLLSWFGDDPSPALCPFGAHAIITGWGRERGVVPGRWLGPCETALALAALTNRRRPGGLAAFVVSGEGGAFGGGAPTVDREAVVRFSAAMARGESAPAPVGERRRRRAERDDSKTSSSVDARETNDSDSSTRLDLPGAPFSAASRPADREWAPTLILVPLVLGLERHVDPRYVPSLVRVLGLSQCAGVLGGRPGSSLFFVGAQDDRLFYLDPHVVHQAVPLRGGGAEEGAEEGADEDADRRLRFAPEAFPVETYHCDAVLHADAGELDPSMALGFYCRTREDFDGLCLELELLAGKAGSTPLLTVSAGKGRAANFYGGGGGRGGANGNGVVPSRSSPPPPPPPPPPREGGDQSEEDDWEML